MRSADSRYSCQLPVGGRTDRGHILTWHTNSFTFRKKDSKYFDVKDLGKKSQTVDCLGRNYSLYDTVRGSLLDSTYCLQGGGGRLGIRLKLYRMILLIWPHAVHSWHKAQWSAMRSGLDLSPCPQIFGIWQMKTLNSSSSFLRHKVRILIPNYFCMIFCRNYMK